MKSIYQHLLIAGLSLACVSCTMFDTDRVIADPLGLSINQYLQVDDKYRIPINPDSEEILRLLDPRVQLQKESIVKEKSAYKTLSDYADAHIKQLKLREYYLRRLFAQLKGEALKGEPMKRPDAIKDLSVLTHIANLIAADLSAVTSTLPHVQGKQRRELIQLRKKLSLGHQKLYKVIMARRHNLGLTA